MSWRSGTCRAAARPADRRRHIVELSPSGMEELAVAYARLSRVEDELLAG